MTSVEYKVNYTQKRFEWDLGTIYVERFQTLDVAKQFQDALDKLDYITGTSITKITTIEEVL